MHLELIGALAKERLAVGAALGLPRDRRGDVCLGLRVEPRRSGLGGRGAGGEVIVEALEEIIADPGAARGLGGRALDWALRLWRGERLARHRRGDGFDR